MRQVQDFSLPFCNWTPRYCGAEHGLMVAPKGPVCSCGSVGQRGKHQVWLRPVITQLIFRSAQSPSHPLSPCPNRCCSSNHDSATTHQVQWRPFCCQLKWRPILPLQLPVQGWPKSTEGKMCVPLTQAQIFKGTLIFKGTELSVAMPLGAYISFSERIFRHLGV